MRRWFLSYHTPDEELAERLKAAIERRDDGAIVFFAPANLRAGVRWAPALAEAIAEATAFVLLVTERGIGRWQEIEYEAAFDKHVNSPDFPIVLMLLEGHAAPRLAGRLLDRFTAFHAKRDHLPTARACIVAGPAVNHAVIPGRMLNYGCAGGLGGHQFRLKFACGYVNPTRHAERLGNVGHDVGLRAAAAASRH